MELLEALKRGDAILMPGKFSTEKAFALFTMEMPEAEWSALYDVIFRGLKRQTLIAENLAAEYLPQLDFVFYLNMPDSACFEIQTSVHRLVMIRVFAIPYIQQMAANLTGFTE